MNNISCQGEVRVPLPVEAAVELFTPEGERRWDPTWDPHYPAHPTDRRTTLATITETGRETAGKATEDLNAIRFGTEPLSRTDVTVITDVLHELRRAAGDFVEPE